MKAKSHSVEASEIPIYLFYYLFIYSACSISSCPHFIDYINLCSDDDQ